MPATRRLLGVEALDARSGGRGRRMHRGDNAAQFARFSFAALS